MLLAAAVAAAVLTGSLPYSRTRTGGGDEAACLFWGEGPLHFSQSVVGNPNTGASAFEAVRSSILTWRQPFLGCGNLDLAEGPRTTDRKVGMDGDGKDVNVVLFRYSLCTRKVPAADRCWEAGTCGNLHDCWEHSGPVFGLTTVTYNRNTGRIVDADVELNSAQNVFTTVNQPPCTGAQLQTCVSADVENTVTHELGHALGLGHVGNLTSTMAPSAQLGETSKRLLDSGSRAFVCEAYPAGLPSRSCVLLHASSALGPPPEQPPAGCSTTGPAGGPWLALLLGVAAGRRRRGAARL